MIGEQKITGCYVDVLPLKLTCITLPMPRHTWTPKPCLYKGQEESLNTEPTIMQGILLVVVSGFIAYLIHRFLIGFWGVLRFIK